MEGRGKGARSPGKNELFSRPPGEPPGLLAVRRSPAGQTAKIRIAGKQKISVDSPPVALVVSRPYVSEGASRVFRSFATLGADVYPHRSPRDRQDAQ